MMIGMSNKSVGRPRGPEKVVFKRRVVPELVSRLDDEILGWALRSLGAGVDKFHASYGLDLEEMRKQGDGWRAAYEELEGRGVVKQSVTPAIISTEEAYVKGLESENKALKAKVLEYERMLNGA